MDWLSLTVGAVASLIGSVLVGAFFFWLSSRDLRTQVKRLEEENQQVQLIVNVLAGALENAGVIGVDRDAMGKISGLSTNVEAPPAFVGAVAMPAATVETTANPINNRPRRSRRRKGSTAPL